MTDEELRENITRVFSLFSEAGIPVEYVTINTRFTVKLRDTDFCLPLERLNTVMEKLRASNVRVWYTTARSYDSGFFGSKLEIEWE